MRDFAFEALAEVTSTDWSVGRGELNAALRDIRKQAGIDDSYLLSAEIHERAKMYRIVFSGVALTPNALAKHWNRVKEEMPKRTGTNLVAHPHLAPPLPPPRHQQGLQEVHKLMETLWPPSSERDIR